MDRGVTDSWASVGAVVRCGVASACDTPPEGGRKSSVTELVSSGGEDVGGVSFLGAPGRRERG